MTFALRHTFSERIARGLNLYFKIKYLQRFTTCWKDCELKKEKQVEDGCSVKKKCPLYQEVWVMQDNTQWNLLPTHAQTHLYGFVCPAIYSHSSQSMLVSVAQGLRLELPLDRCQVALLWLSTSSIFSLFGWLGCVLSKFFRANVWKCLKVAICAQETGSAFALMSKRLKTNSSKCTNQGNKFAQILHKLHKILNPPVLLNDRNAARCLVGETVECLALTLRRTDTPPYGAKCALFLHLASTRRGNPPDRLAESPQVRFQESD